MSCFWVKLVNAECEVKQDTPSGGLLPSMVQKSVNYYYNDTFSWTGPDTWANGSWVSSMWGLVGNGLGQYFTSVNLSAGASTTIIVDMAGNDPPGGDLDYVNGSRFLVGDESSLFVVGYVRGIPEGYPPSELRLYPLSSGNIPVYTGWPGSAIPDPPQYDAWNPSAKAGSHFYVTSNDEMYEISYSGSSSTTLSLVAVLLSAGYISSGSIYCDAFTFSSDGSKCLMALSDYGRSSLERRMMVELTLDSAFNLASGSSIQELAVPSEGSFYTGTLSGVSYTPNEDGFVLCNRSGWLAEYGV